MMNFIPMEDDNSGWCGRRLEKYFYLLRLEGKTFLFESSQILKRLESIVLKKKKLSQCEYSFAESIGFVRKVWHQNRRFKFPKLSKRFQWKSFRQSFDHFLSSQKWNSKFSTTVIFPRNYGIWKCFGFKFIMNPCRLLTHYKG